ncbi:MAG: STAS domain-containing protein [Phycisphaeraceae bacterium]|nr:STAS domain-containing protein [Phycisphaeraceae bacterium]
MEFLITEVDGDVMVLAVDGGLERDTVEQFNRTLEKIIDMGVRRIIVDCRKLSYISSYGLGVLLTLHRRMKKLGGDVKLAGVPSAVISVLAVTHLSGYFDIHDDVSRAKLAFRPIEDV